MNTTMAKKSEVAKMKKGTYLSETQYYRVDGIDSNIVNVTNERNFSFDMGFSIAEEGSYSADQYDKDNVQEVTRTQLIEIFSKVGDTVFTVSFNTQPKAEDINEAIASANKGKIIPIADLQKIVKTAYKGKERILIGYLISTETGFGRSMVIDLEADTSKSTADWDARIRQCDHRTLNWLISKNVKYMIKK